MPVSVESAVSGPFTPNGVATTFAFTFKAGSSSEVAVVDQSGNALSPALYSVSLDDDEGGSVIFSVAPSASDYDELYIISNPALTQTADFDNAGPSFNPASLTRALDRAAVRDLKQQAEIDRTFKVPFGEAGPTFPPASARANLYPVFDADGNMSTSAGTGADLGLRSDIASTDTGKGADLVGCRQSQNGYDGPPSKVNAVLDQTIRIKSLGAVGDGTFHPLSEFYGSLAAAQAVYPFVTALTQGVDWAAIQLACLISYNNASGVHPDIDLGFGCFVIDETVQAYHYNRLSGRSAGTVHSQSAFATKGYNTTLLAKAGFNGPLFLLDANSTYTGNTTIGDFCIERVCARGNWTGPGDATNTTGRFLQLDDVYFIQNAYLQDLVLHNFAEDAIYGNVVPFPARFWRIWGRYIGGAVIRFDYSAARGGHSFLFDDIQGDFVVGPLIKIDGSLRVAASANMLGEAFTFRTMKHEIDSSASSTTAYSPDSIELKNLDRATVLIESINAEPSDPIGTAGTPATNSILKVTGTTAPFYEVRNCRMGSPASVTDYLVDDEVRAIQIPKVFRSYSISRERRQTSVGTATDQVMGSRVISESTGTAEAYDRFKRDGAGKMEWGAGSADVDTNLYREAADRLRSDDTLTAKRFQCRGGTALVAGDFALSAGWGDAASVSVDANSTDGAWRITVTADGTGIAANPTITLTFKENYPVAPRRSVQMGYTGTGPKGAVYLGTPASGSLTFQAVITPVSGQTHVFEGLAL